MLAVFVVMATALTGVIAQQRRQAALQEAEEQAFNVAEAGINYGIWYLNAGGGEAFFDGKEVHEPPVNGKFSLVIVRGPEPGPDFVLISAGFVEHLRERCQKIDAEVTQQPNGIFTLTRWVHGTCS